MRRWKRWGKGKQAGRHQILEKPMTNLGWVIISVPRLVLEVVFVGRN